MTFGLTVISFLLLGILLYWFDATAGRGIYRSWFALTHKDPLPEGSVRGFMVNRTVRPRITLLVILTVLCYAVWFSLNKVTVPDILIGLLGFVCTLIGTYLAPLIIRTLPKSVNKTLDYVEQVEKGEVDLGADLGEKAREVGEGIKEAAGDLRKEVTPKSAGKAKGKAIAAEDKSMDPDSDENADQSADDPGEEKPDWREGVKKYLDK
jgi:hypothetical protein